MQLTDFTEVVWDFNREDDGQVWVRVDLDLGVTMTLVSDEPSGCRDWALVELDIAFEKSTGHVALRRHEDVPYESDLGRALSREFDKFVSNEDRFVRSHYGRPS